MRATGPSFGCCALVPSIASETRLPLPGAAGAAPPPPRPRLGCRALVFPPRPSFGCRALVPLLALHRAAARSHSGGSWRTQRSWLALGPVEATRAAGDAGTRVNGVSGRLEGPPCPGSRSSGRWRPPRAARQPRWAPRAGEATTAPGRRSSGRWRPPGRQARPVLGSTVFRGGGGHQGSTAATADTSGRLRAGLRLKLRTPRTAVLLGT